MKKNQKITICSNKNSVKKISTRLFIILFLSYFIIMIFYAPKVFATPISESKLIQFTNQERSIRGLNALKPNPQLYFAAKTKAHDMIEKDYFEHYTPYGKSPWDFIHETGYKYVLAGENLAMDFRTSEGINNAWMVSSTHKENIIKPEYEDIAIAVVKGDFQGHQTAMVVQMFGRQNDNIIFNVGDWMTKIRNFILGF